MVDQPTRITIKDVKDYACKAIKGKDVFECDIETNKPTITTPPITSVRNVVLFRTDKEHLKPVSVRESRVFRNSFDGTFYGYDNLKMQCMVEPWISNKEYNAITCTPYEPEEWKELQKEKEKKKQEIHTDIEIT